MKRVLWICNIMLPAIAKVKNLTYSNREGWLSGIFGQIAGRKDEAGKEVTLGVCYPVERKDEEEQLTVEGISCYGFCEDLLRPERYTPDMERRFAEIFADFRPDIIHIFGTEFPHALAAARAFGRPERTLVGIQGLCNEIAKVYMAGLPEAVCRSRTFRDIVRQDSLMQQQEKFVRRGEHEIELLRLSGHITGRTRFDREGSLKWHQDARYHRMNETMRSSFYSGEWKWEECDRHRIFLGQGDYPLKGFHFLLKAMPLLLARYPDAKVYVAGNSIVAHNTWKEKLKLSAYGKYLLSLMEKYSLWDKVTILGRLCEEEMKEQYLKAAVYVCPSVLENSPNTVGEAMLLGVPVVASKTGGIPDMITDGEDGLLFPVGDTKALAKSIESVFDRELAGRLSEGAKRRAGAVHDGESNYRRLLEIYEEI